MDALECIATRRSIRRFLEVPVDFETMMTILEAGSLAPSSGNIQDWRFILITEKELQHKIADLSMGQDCVHNAAFLVVACVDTTTTERRYGLRGQRLYAVQDCAAAIENMLLAAHALEVGGVWIGAFDEEKLKFLLGMPPEARPQAVLAFGYPSEAPDQKIIRELNMVTFFNSYGMKIKNFSRLVNDYSLDWQQRINTARTFIGQMKEKSKEVAKETTKVMTKEGGSFLKKYKDKIKEKFKKNNDMKK